MPYWLKNEEHGVMPVYDASEVERHKKWGWVLLNQGESPQIAEPKKGEAVEFAPARKKPGPKPKNKAE